MRPEVPPRKRRFAGVSFRVSRFQIIDLPRNSMLKLVNLLFERCLSIPEIGEQCAMLLAAVDANFLVLLKTFDLSLGLLDRHLHRAWALRARCSQSSCCAANPLALYFGAATKRLCRSRS